jgi:hypothetical protein
MIKIVEQSAHQLVLYQNRVSRRRLWGELLLTGVGIGFLTWLGPARLDCQRLEPHQISCQLSKPGWSGLGIWRNQSIVGLQSVKLKKQPVDEGGEAHQILLQTPTKTFPVREYLSSGLDNNQESVDRLRQFLKNPQAQQLSIAQVDWCQWFGLVTGLGFLLIGGRLLYISLFSIKFKSIESYAFDQNQQRLTYEYGGLLRKKQEFYAFSDIQQLVLDFDPWAKTRLFLELRSGKVLCLNGQIPKNQLLWQGEAWQSMQSIADQVSQKINCPWKLTVGFGKTWLQEQLTRNKYARAFLGNIEPVKIWVFDRSNRSISYQNGAVSQTYYWQDVIDVQALAASKSNTTLYRDDGHYYMVEYQTNLLLNSGKPLPIQNFLYREDYWEPSSGQPSTAQNRAEESAQCLRQFINPTLLKEQDQELDEIIYKN